MITPKAIINEKLGYKLLGSVMKVIASLMQYHDLLLRNKIAAAASFDTTAVVLNKDILDLLKPKDYFLKP